MMHCTPRLQVEITSPSTSNTYVFYANQWVPKAPNVDDPSTWISLQALPQTAEAAAIDYVVKVHTSKMMGAGTGAKVHLEMRSLTGSSGQLVLQSTKGKHFSSGNMDVFKVHAPDVGDVDELLITQDGAGFGSDWHLAKVGVGCLRCLHPGHNHSSGAGASLWQFDCYRTLQPVFVKSQFMLRTCVMLTH